MKYHVLKIKREKTGNVIPFNPEEIGENIMESQKDNTDYAVFKNIDFLYYATINIPNEGGIFFELTKGLLDINGELCSGYIEYLGFRDTLESKDIQNTIKNSLEKLCELEERELK